MGMKHGQEGQENEQVRMQNETETPARDRASITTGRLVYRGYRITQESTCYTSNLQASFPGESAQLALAEGASARCFRFLEWLPIAAPGSMYLHNMCDTGHP